MARIRNIKPAFFRHEKLQDLEAEHPGQYVMLTYVGLWTQCDAAGIFPWKPRLLKLDILPFLEFSIERTMTILQSAGFIARYTADGETWGYIPTFDKHQRITGKEATEGEKYPKPDENKSGNTWETSGKHPGAQERSTGKDNREGVNAHAHEGFPKNEKNETPGPPQSDRAPTPPTPLGEGSGEGFPLGDFARLYQTISAWGETDAGHAEIVEWKKITGYRDSQHGPTTDEVTKFVSYHLGAKSTAEKRRNFIADPLQFFRDQFPGWLTNAKAWNGAPRARGKPPNNAREYTGQHRRSGASTTPAPLAALITTPQRDT